MSQMVEFQLLDRNRQVLIELVLPASTLFIEELAALIHELEAIKKKMKS